MRKFGEIDVTQNGTVSHYDCFADHKFDFELSDKKKKPDGTEMSGLQKNHAMGTGTA